MNVHLTCCVIFGRSFMCVNVNLYSFVYHKNRTAFRNLFSAGPNKKPRHPVVTHQTSPLPPPPKLQLLLMLRVGGTIDINGSVFCTSPQKMLGNVAESTFQLLKWNEEFVASRKIKINQNCFPVCISTIKNIQ